MSKYLIIVYMLLFCISCKQNEIIIPVPTLNESFDVKDNGDYISVLCLKSAVLYNKAGKEVYRSSIDNKHYLIYGEYVPTYKYFLTVIGKRYDSTEVVDGYDRLKATDIITGRTVWETNILGDGFELSPDGKYLVTETNPDNDENPGLSELFSITKGTKLKSAIPNNINEAKWLDNDRFIYVSSNIERIEPNNISVEQQNWYAKWQERHSAKENEFKNNKISQAEFDKYKTEAEKEKSDSEIEYNVKFSDAIKYIYRSTLNIFNVVTNRIETKKELSTGDNNVFYVSDEFINPGIKLNIDSDKNIFVQGEINPHSALIPSRVIIKLDKNFNLVWKSAPLPLSSITPFILDQKPYYGFFINKEEYFVEPVKGAFVPFSEVSKTFSEIPSISSIRKSHGVTYKYTTDFKVDFNKQCIIIKKKEVK